MNEDSNNTKQLWCNSLFIRLGDKAVFLAFALGIISLLSACVSIPNPNEPPVRISDFTYQDAGQNAYLWTSGSRWGKGIFNKDGFFLNLADFATITRINNVNVPDEYLPKAGELPLYSWLLEIPAGKHVIEILYKEEDLVSGIFCYGLCALFFEKSQQTLTLMAEPNQTYHPFTADDCSKNYFWIEDWGPYVAGTETAQAIWNLHETDLTKPVVAGERPKKDSCATPADEKL